MLKTENKDSIKELKYLVIDDEISCNQRYRQNFIKSLGMINTSAKFAETCEDGLNAIQEDSEILFCLLDCRLPGNKEGRYNYSPENSINAGIRLIPDILKVNKDFPIVMFSAYVSLEELVKETRKHNSYSYISCLNKNEKKEYYIKVIKEVIKHIGLSAEQYFSSENKTHKMGRKRSEKSKSIEFSLDDLSPETQEIIKSRTEEIKRLLRKSAQDIFDIGRYLTEVKGHLKHGQFLPWLQSELKWSAPSAARFMRVYEKFKLVKLTNLNLAPSVLYELSNNSVPIEAVNETVELARGGETISYDQAKKIKEKFIDRKKTVASNKIEQKVKDNNNNNILDTNAQKSLDFPPILEDTPNDENISIRQEILQVISPKRVWNLGNHTLLCQDPNSPMFINKLPSEISLCLGFPPNKNWSWQSNRYKSINIFFSEYKDLDASGLLESVRNILEVTTNGGDNIVVCYIPDPKILSIIDDLGCKAFIAEPDNDKCLALVNSKS